jgi:hypothetical protein
VEGQAEAYDAAVAWHIEKEVGIEASIVAGHEEEHVVAIGTAREEEDAVAIGTSQAGDVVVDIGLRWPPCWAR